MKKYFCSSGMKFPMRYIILFIISFFLSGEGLWTRLFALQSTVDSLETLLKTSKEDTDKVNIFISLSQQLRTSDLKKAAAYAEEARQLSENLKYEKGLGMAFSTSGVINYFEGNFDNALKNYSIALKHFRRSGYKKGIANIYVYFGVFNSKKELFDSALFYYNKAGEIYSEINEKPGIASCFTNSGIIYDKLGKYSEAIQKHLDALKIYDELNDKNGKASCYLNIGAIQYLRENYKEAVEYFLKSAELFEQLNNVKNLAFVLNNIAAVYVQQKKYESALKYYLDAYNLRKSAGFSSDIAESLTNIGNVYIHLENYKKSLEYLQKALEIAVEANDKWSMIYAYSGLGFSYTHTNDINAAIVSLNKGIDLAGELKLKRELQILFERISIAYEMKRDYKNAYEFQKKFSEVKDSLLNEESGRQIAEMQSKYESEKKQKEIELLQKDKALQETEIAKKDAEVKKQNTQKIAFGAGFSLVFLLALVIFRGYKNKQKANELLSFQKSEIENKNTHLEKANTEISQQKKEIEEKNNEILSSIRYAQRIQEAILPPQKLVKQYLEKSFILYKPKDIVAGDFYWMHSRSPLEKGAQGEVLFAACDCTGHGVPGAFVSIVAHNVLNRAVKEFGLKEPAKILDKVNKLVQETFSKSENEMKDGMDVALCALEFHSPDGNGSSVTLQYAGANNSIYLVRNNVLTEIKADKQPIGNYAAGKPFTNNVIALQSNDAIYAFSDGYADQFGGPKGKKFKYSQFENLLISIQDKSMTEQREILNETIDNWRAWPAPEGGVREMEQIDDICIIGVRV